MTHTLNIPEDVRALCARLRDHGHDSWVVGGCVRDMLLGRPIDDWDLATSARPEQVKACFRKVIPTGIQHGTVTVRFRGQSYELTTLRGEGAYSDGRRPDSVHFVDDIEADLARRDFTCNAIALDPFEMTLIDPFGGVADLDRRIVRAVRDPRERFEEDGLRVLRGARFVASLEAELDPATEAAIRPTLATFAQVSPERVREEWLKTLKAPRPSRAFAVMRRTGIWEATLGERAAAFDDARFEAALCAVDRVAGPGARIARLAGLLHPLCDQRQAVEGWLRDYRYSNAERAEVVRLHGVLARELDPSRLDVELRRLAASVGREHTDAGLSFRAAVLACMHGEDSAPAVEARAQRERARQVLTPEVALSQRELAVTGQMLIEQVGVPRGPQVGRLLARLFDEVLDDPARNEREALLRRAGELREA